MNSEYQTPHPDPHKSQVVICLLKNSGTDLSQEAIRSRGPIASRGSSVPPSIKYVND